MDSTRSAKEGTPAVSSELTQTVDGLSIIIPNYNHAHYLPDAIRSRLNQSVPPLEVIVVDDASTDDSVLVIRQECTRDPRVRLVCRPINGGPNAAIVSGLAVARGRFITCSAADDIVEPEFVEFGLAALRQYPLAALCFMDPCMLHEESGVSESVPLALAKSPAYFSPDAFERLMRDNYFTISSNTVIYRREPILQLGGFRPELKWQADWMTNLVLAFRHGVCYVPRTLATVTLRSGTYSWSGLRQRFEQRRLLYRCLDTLQDDYLDVAPRFRRAALIPEMRLRNFGWLLMHRQHRRYLTTRLILRLIARDVWRIVRLVTPLETRRWWRRRSAKRALKRGAA